MPRPSPALVTQSAVQRLPRYSLWLLTLAYVLPGFWGRDAWRIADLADFERMKVLAAGGLAAGAAHQPWSDVLGAWAIQLLTPWGVSALTASRWPFMLLLGLTLACTWYAVYYLARDADVQPVSFAFGGEASPRDYARTVADGGFLALMASMGLAQLSHETTALPLQLAFASALFLGFAQAPYKVWNAAATLTLGAVGLAGSGAPGLAVSLLIAGTATAGLHTRTPEPSTALPAARVPPWPWWLWVCTVVLGLLVWQWEAMRAIWSATSASPHWRGVLRVYVWFTWPAWPLAIWTIWQWRLHLRSRAIAWPLVFFALVCVKVVMAVEPRAEFALLAGLPALAALSAFALPTLRRSWAAFIDWFTLVFFSGCALVIWGCWLALHSGWPAPLHRLVSSWVPGFEPHIQPLPVVCALAGTLAWGVLVRWRTLRLRDQIWKTLVLPATGAVLCWLLLTTLWLPALNHVYTR